MEPANNRPEPTQLASFRSTVRHIESILLRQSTIYVSDAHEPVKLQLIQLEGQFQQLLERNRQLEREVQKVRGQSRGAQLIATTTVTSRPNPLASLPDLCLLALFGQLPLLDQLTARQTCARWSTLLLHVTQTRLTLNIYLHPLNTKGNYAVTNLIYKGICTLCIGPESEFDTISQLQKEDGSQLFPCWHLTAWSRLSVASLSATLNQQIGATFSRIKKLELKVCSSKSPDNAENLVSLVEQLGPRLEAFHLYLSGSLMSKSVTDRLYAAINAMSSLLYLNLDLKDRFPHHDLPVISRLEELHFYNQSTRPEQFAEMLQRYAEGNDALRRIDYHTSTFWSHGITYRLSHFTRLSRRLRHCFTTFNATLMSRQPPNIVQLICDHFHSLTSFNLKLDITIPIRFLFDQLSQLTQLAVLRLKLHFTNQPLDDETARRPLPQLPSIALLHLQPHLRSHRNLDQLALPWTMPNLQVICFDLSDSRCTDCHEARFPFTEWPANFECVLECTRQLFRPLMAQCGRLRLIRHSEEDVLGAAEELLA